MARILLTTILLVTFISCKKEIKSSGFENFFNKLLVCDSVKTETNGAISVMIVGKGKGFDLLFSPTASAGRYGTNGTYTRYSSPNQKMNFRYERPEKLYYWPLNSSIHEGDYFTIQSATGKNEKRFSGERG